MSNAFVDYQRNPPLTPPTQNQRHPKNVAFRWPSEELFRAAEAVEAMLSTDGWQAVMRLVDELVELQQSDLFRTMPVNQVAAAQFAGKIEGLQGARVCADAIRAAAENKRSQLEQRNAAEAAGGSTR